MRASILYPRPGLRKIICLLPQLLRSPRYLLKLRNRGRKKSRSEKKPKRFLTGRKMERVLRRIMGLRRGEHIMMMPIRILSFLETI